MKKRKPSVFFASCIALCIASSGCADNMVDSDVGNAIEDASQQWDAARADAAALADGAIVDGAARPDGAAFDTATRQDGSVLDTLPQEAGSLLDAATHQDAAVDSNPRGDAGSITGLTITPTEVTLRPQAQQLFVVTLTENALNKDAFTKDALTRDASVDAALPVLQWQVNGVVGGDDENGHIVDGRYTAPSEVPSHQPVVVRAQLAAAPGVAAEALVTIDASPTHWIEISPAPTMVGLRNEIQFGAVLHGDDDQGLRWLVNGTEMGNAGWGAIEEDGHYRAPGELPETGGSVVVEAVSTAFPTVRAGVSMRLVDLRLSPDGLAGTAPGQVLEFTARAHYSDGSSEDVTALDTTVVRLSNPAVATSPNPGQLVLGDAVGGTLALVEDQRLSPPAKEQIRVANLPTYTMSVEPAGVTTLRRGERLPLQVLFEADRGPEAGNKQDITQADSIAALAGDGDGLVSTDGSAPAQAPDTYVAYLDLPARTIVTGAKPGRTSFEIQEELSGKAATVEVHLVDLALRVAVNGAALDANGQFCQSLTPAGLCAPFAAYTPGDENELPEVNGYVALNVMLRDAENQIPAPELQQLLSGTVVRYEVVSGSGRLGDHNLYMQAFGGVCPHRVDMSDPVLYSKPFEQQPRLRPEGSTCNPSSFSFSVARFAPTSLGEHRIKISLPGLALSQGLEPPSFELTVDGVLPKLKPRFYRTVGDPIEYGVRYGLGVELVDTQADGSDWMHNQGAHGFKVKLMGRKPGGGSLNADEQKRVVWPGDGWPGVLASFDESGEWELWLEAEQHPGQPLGGSSVYRVEPVTFQYAEETTAVVFQSLATLRSYYDSGGTFSVQLRTPGGGVLSTLDEDNQFCLQERPDDPSAAVGSAGVILQGRKGWDEVYRHFEQGVQYLDFGLDGVDGRIRVDEGPRQQRSGMPPVGSSTLQYSVQVLKPLCGSCTATVTFSYLYQDDSDCAQRPDADSTEVEVLQLRAQPMRLVPATLLVPRNPAQDTAVTASTVLYGDDLPQALAPADFTVLSTSEELPETGIEVAAVEPVEGGWLLTFRFAAERVAELVAGDILQLDNHFVLLARNADVPVWANFRVGAVWLEGLAGEPDFQPLPLNARPTHDEPAGTTRLVVRTLGVESTGTLVPLQVEAEEDSEDFRLVAFARRSHRENDQGGLATEMGSTQTTVAVSYSGASHPVQLYGNLTDEHRSLMGQEIGMPDFIPDVVSAAEGSVTINLVDSHTGTRTALASTTAFVFEPVRRGQLRHGPLNPTTLASYDDIADNFNWPELAGKPDQACEPLTSLVASVESREIYPHVDNMQNGHMGGMADMRYVSIDGQTVLNDGRVHAFTGEDPIGRPSAVVQSGNAGWEWYGVELDGVCYDPGFGNDVAPNSEALFRAWALADDPVPVDYNTGLVPGIGGTSGGGFAPQDGRFLVVTRTPGVDFPGLDCGFQVSGKPEDLGEDDYEEVAIDDSLVRDAELVDMDPEQRVFTFADARDFKERIMSGLSTRGANSAFVVTTRPLGADGSPLVNASLKADLLVGEWPHFTDGDEGILLTARVDGDVQVYVVATRWLVPVLAAAVTGAIGAHIEGTAILSGIGWNVLVSLGFSTASEVCGLHMEDGLSEAVAGTAGSKLAGTIGKRALKALRFVVRYGRGATQSVVRNAVTQPLVKSMSASSLSMGQDVAGGMISSMITKWITESLLSGTGTGTAEGFAFDQLWVQIPASALVDSDDPGGRTFAVADMRVATLSGRDKVDHRRGVYNIPENDESDSYREKRARGTGPLVLTIANDATAVASNDATPTCQSGDNQQVDVANFRLQVGGDTPTEIPYMRTSLNGAVRTSEEATVRVKTDRSRTPVYLYLLDVEMVE